MKTKPPLLPSERNQVSNTESLSDYKTRTMKYPPVTNKSIAKGMRHALMELSKNESLLAHQTSIGFIMDKKKGTGLQVFLKLSKYDEALLKKDNQTGGLLEYDKE